MALDFANAGTSLANRIRPFKRSMHHATNLRPRLELVWGHEAGTRRLMLGFGSFWAAYPESWYVCLMKDHGKHYEQSSLCEIDCMTANSPIIADVGVTRVRPQGITVMGS